MVDTISENSGLNISCVIDGAKVYETQFAKVLNEIREEEKKEKKRQEAESFPENRIAKNGQFYRGTLRSGQKIEVDGSIVILGDINPGAQIVAGGNVVVLGCLKGTVHAGYPEDSDWQLYCALAGSEGEEYKEECQKEESSGTAGKACIRGE